MSSHEERSFREEMGAAEEAEGGGRGQKNEEEGQGTTEKGRH